MNKEILRLAIPNIISNISIPLLGMADLAVLGHLESERYMGAIAIGGTIFNFIYWGFAFLRMGTSGMTAQEYGKNNLLEAIAILFRALMVSFVAGLLIILIQQPIAWLSFGLIKGSLEVEAIAYQYYIILIWATPAALGLFAITGWFIGMQNANIPMIINIIIFFLNIAFNLWFVFGLGMKADGVAWGTLISLYIGFAVGLSVIFYQYKAEIRAVNWYIVLKISEIKRFFSINTDIFIRMICIIFVFTFFNFQSAAKGDTILAVNSVLMSFFMFFSFFADGFAYAGEALVGKYVGSRNYEKLMQTIRYQFIWGVTIGVFMSGVYAFAGINIMKLITNQPNVIAAAEPYIFWAALIPVISFTSFIWDGIYIGATATRLMRNTMLIAAFVIFLPSYLILSHYFEHQALWLSFVLFMLGRGILQSLLYKKAISAHF